jgi:RNA polymerase sigma factor (sigma-70 family)
MSHHFDHDQPDKHLVNLVLLGDHAAFAIIIRKTERLVTQIVYKMIPLVEDRKDIAQDIYLKVFNNLAGFRFQCKLSTWVAQIAYNTCGHFLEKKKLVLLTIPEESADYLQDMPGDKRIENEANPIESAVFRKDLQKVIESGIETLPLLYQTLIVLYHQEEMPYEEITLVTGLPVGTIKSYLFRARKKLREAILKQYKKEDL